MMTEFKKNVFATVLILCATLTVYADWSPSDGHKMHFPQLPDPCGWDIDLRDYWLADDWQCSKTGEVNDIHFWVSCAKDGGGTISSVQVKIYSNDPNPPFSKPRNLLWSRTFPSSGFVVRLDPAYGDEGYWIPDTNVPELYQLYPHDHRRYSQVNIKDINDPFVQVEGQIYWLSLRVTLSEPDRRVGWKTSLDHFMDTAVIKFPWGWSPLYEPNTTMPIDFSFVITGGPNEPSYPTNAKWLQRPDLSANGIDVMASDLLILADDFECNKSTLITDITVWGSWKNDILPPNGPNDVWFTLSIHSDIPSDPCIAGSYSMPGTTLWFKLLMPSEVSIEREGINEGWWDPCSGEYVPIGDTICWKYVFRIPPQEAFCQQGEPNKPIVYWLDVKAFPKDLNGWAKFGWKSSINHWNDDAVRTLGYEPYIGPWYELRYPLGHPLEPNSIDLAFAIDGNTPCNMPENDLGDAPDSSNSSGIAMTAYPAAGVAANYPTVYAAGSPPFGPLHLLPTSAFYLGGAVSLENEADTGPDQDPQNNIIPLTDTPNMDGSDDGVTLPIRMPRCRLVRFNYTVTVVDTTKPIFANVWCDFNRDGDWDDVPMCGSKPAPEWAVQNQPLAFALPGAYTVQTPPFRTFDNLNQPGGIADIWMRITLSETPWASSGSGGSGPPTGYVYGETEDYFFVPDLSCWNCADFDLSGIVNMKDLRVLAEDWLWFGLAGGYVEPDLDCDGDVQFDDFAILAEQWYIGCP